MKVIDLLNKIANGEEVPIIKYKNNIIKYNKNIKRWDDVKTGGQVYWSTAFEFKCLNDEVEIIEDKKIKQITIDDELVDEKTVLDNIGLQRNLIKLTNKIKEIIDKLNEMSDKE